MIRIEAIPEIFRNSEIIEYPIHNKSEGIEQKFSTYIDSNNTPRSKLKYLPIQWTNYLIKNNYGKNIEDLQLYCDDLIKNNPNERYFTVVQYDGGPIVNLNNCVVFSSGGMFGTKNNENLSFIPIPLLTDPHKRIRPKKKKYKIGYIGRNTHPIRGNLEDLLSINNENLIINIPSDGVSKKDSKKFKDVLSKSIFSLCPRGFGPASFRLYESLEFGSIPIYVSDDFHLPYRDIIDWEKLCLLIKLDEINTIEKKVNDLINSGKFLEMINYGKFCHKNYFNFEYTISNIISEVEKF
jgi:hypothetical protein